MGFKLDQHSLDHLNGVHPDLVRVVFDCAENGTMPFIFGVSEGLRTIEQQKADVAAGKSETMDSRHLDGHAVDLVVLLPVAGGEPRISWAWPSYYILADQMKQAGARQKVPLNWGGVWDRELAQLSDDMERESAEYVLRMHAIGKRGFQDGPHFQLPFTEYPRGPFHVPAA